MPKISAATVAEHRSLVRERLIDAAEQILRSGQQDRLTASAVTSEAGIARNSIYRYVESVDDLRGMVLARYLPEWLSQLREALHEVSEPGERIVVWLDANLAQAALVGHGWMMAMGGDPGKITPTTRAVMEDAHELMRDTLLTAWLELVPDNDRAMAAAAMTRGVLEAGFRQLDAGADPALVRQVATQLILGGVASLRER